MADIYTSSLNVVEEIPPVRSNIPFYAMMAAILGAAALGIIRSIKK